MGAIRIALDFVALAAICATLSAFVTPAFAPNGRFARCIAISFWSWAKICAAFLSLYLIQILDKNDANLSPFYFVFFVAAGSYLLSHDLKEEGLAANFPGIGAAVALLILIALGCAYAVIDLAPRMG